MVARKASAPGDIVISCIGRPPLVYCVTGSSFQSVTYANYDDALESARQVASRARVDVWVDEERDELTLVARYRPDTWSTGGARGGTPCGR
jgi:hypothetical protein